jgi:hypothetical protein
LVGFNIDLNVGDIRHRHLFYSDIGKKYGVGLIPEMFRYRHQSPFRYPILKFFYLSLKLELTYASWFHSRAPYNSATMLNYEVWDVEYRIKLYSDICYNVGFRSLQSNIGGSDIRLSPISLITEIGLSSAYVIVIVIVIVMDVIITRRYGK